MGTRRQGTATARFGAHNVGLLSVPFALGLVIVAVAALVRRRPRAAVRPAVLAASSLALGFAAFCVGYGPCDGDVTPMFVALVASMSAALALLTMTWRADGVQRAVDAPIERFMSKGGDRLAVEYPLG